MSARTHVLHFGTRGEICGIGKYQDQTVRGLQTLPQLENEFFPLSPNQLRQMVDAERQGAIDQLLQMMDRFDVLHVQHEHSFFVEDELAQIVARLQPSKRVVITVHTVPHAHEHYRVASLRGFGPRSLLAYGRDLRAQRRFERNQLGPMASADLVLVPNAISKESLIACSVPHEHIAIWEHPITLKPVPPRSTAIGRKLQRTDGDVIFGMVGFVTKSKGVLDAVRALNLLPRRYKLALVGSTHPSGRGEEFLDEVCDLVARGRLQDRVYITGHVESDEELDSLTRELDVCVFPYDPRYYGYVSSAALSQAVASGRAVIAYPTRPMLETNGTVPFIHFCRAFNHQELARTLTEFDRNACEARTRAYGDAFSITRQAVVLAEHYRRILAAASPRALRG